MLHSRRGFMTATAAATLGTLPLELPAQARADKGGASPEEILAVFKGLPGDVGVKIYAPAVNGKPEFLVESNASKTMFVGSAIKTFILCEALRQADSPTVVQALMRNNCRLMRACGRWIARRSTLRT
jgi:beta-lactamase class A